MSNIQTGSNQAVHPLPRRDPWASFALHGMPPEVPHPHAPVSPGRPPWAVHQELAVQHGWDWPPKARRRVGWRGLLAALGVTALAVGSCGAPAPAAVPQAPAPVVFDWSTPPTPKTVPASQRRIEVVDRLTPVKWRVGAAAEWLDRYTASNMVVVARCSGRAWKCVTVKGGKLSGNKLAVAYSRTVIVDTAKVDRRGYRSDGARKRILAHELAHTFGLGHSSGRNLMATTLGRVALTLNKSQRAYLKRV